MDNDTGIPMGRVLPLQRRGQKKNTELPSASALTPFSKELEQGLLGTILRTPARLTEVIDVLSPMDFYMEGHKVLYMKILDMFNSGEEGEKLDPIILGEVLNGCFPETKNGGLLYIAELMEGTVIARNLKGYAESIKDFAQKRSMISVFLGAIEDLSSLSSERTTSEILSERLDEISATIRGDESSGNHILKPAKKLMNRLNAMMNGEIPPVGEKTDFTCFDVNLGGFRSPDLHILAARPSVGKTALALNLVKNLAMNGTPVGVFSLEMSEGQLMDRMACSKAGVDSQPLMHGTLSEEDMISLMNATAELSTLPIYINENSALSIAQMRTQIKIWKMKSDIKVVVLDYLQLMSGVGKTREEEISSISRGLKNIAKDFKVHVLALSQLNRKVEDRADKVPTLSDLRESGAIEQDADIVTFIHREPGNDGINAGQNTQIIIRKNRNGPVGVFKLEFDGATTTFREGGSRLSGQANFDVGAVEAPESVFSRFDKIENFCQTNGF